MMAKMDRRSFLKGAAVLTVSLALAGCEVEWDDGMAEVELPAFYVTMKSVEVICGEVQGAEEQSLRVTGKFNLNYTGKGFTASSYRDVFGAKLGETGLDIKTSGSVVASDKLIGQNVTYTVEFEKREKDLCTRYKAGEPLVLTVTLQNSVATFTYKYNGDVGVVEPLF